MIFCPSAVNLDIQLWLEHLGLERYLKDFKEEGINSVKDLKTREINDDLFDTLNVNAPGHRNRIKWAGNYLPFILSKMFTRLLND